MSNRFGNPQPFFAQDPAFGERPQFGMAYGEEGMGLHGGQEDLPEALAAPRPLEGRHGLPEAVDPPKIESAEASYRQALALDEELGMRPLQAHSRRGLGILYTQIGRREQAREELSTAIALYRAMEMQFWLPQAEAALVQVT